MVLLIIETFKNLCKMLKHDEAIFLFSEMITMIMTHLFSSSCQGNRYLSVAVWVHVGKQ